eukprot:scaffold8708_cov157-Skeletonema_marinoi.AAC.1
MSLRIVNVQRSGLVRRELSEPEIAWDGADSHWFAKFANWSPKLSTLSSLSASPKRYGGTHLLDIQYFDNGHENEM